MHLEDDASFLRDHKIKIGDGVASIDDSTKFVPHILLASNLHGSAARTKSPGDYCDVDTSKLYSIHHPQQICIPMVTNNDLIHQEMRL